MQIEGRNPVLEALSAGRTFDKVMVQKNAEGGSAREITGKLKDKGIKIQFVDKDVLDKTSLEGRHQGFIAYVSDFKYCALEDILSAEGRKLIVVLDGINDPHNFGGMIRTCECAGASIVIGKNRSVSVTETVERISQGASSHVKIARVTNVNDAIRKFKEQGIWVMAAESGGKPMTTVNLKGDIAVVIGSEGEGVARLTKELSDEVISIPMLGKVNSLNAGVALGVVLYEVLRQNAVL